MGNFRLSQKKKKAHQEQLSYTNNRPILNDSSEVQQLEDRLSKFLINM
jgi:hypothetical protein